MRSSHTILEGYKNFIFRSTMVAFLLFTFIYSACAAEMDVDICSMVSQEQLKILTSETLHSKMSKHQCIWSRVPNGIAFFSIQLRPCKKELRSYFAAKLPETTQLIPIMDLGDEGLMSIVDGALGVVLIRKGNRMLQSAVIFLDIKQNSSKQKALWDIYGQVLDQF